MKHISTLVIALLCVIAIIVAQTENSQKPATAKTAEKKEATVEDKGVPKIMGGMIVAVDATKNLITVRVKSNNYTLSITPQTDLVAKDNKISFPDLKKGDYVTCNYLKFKNGKRKAEKINNKTLAVKLAKIQSKSEPQAKPSQKKEVTDQPKTEPAQKKEIKAGPKPEPEPAQKEKTKPAEKKNTKLEAK